MARWFRFYDDAVNDPKVQRLEPKLFKAWINMLCLASQGDGWLPPAGDVAFTLRVTEAEAGRLVDGLVSSGLLDEYDGRYTPHNWNGRQFKSDVSNERVKRHRQRKCNVTSTVTETPPDTEQITEQKEDTPSGVSPPKVYAFEDGVIRLNQRDFDAWAKAFSHIELSAELLSLSQWASTQGDKWFHAVKGALAKRNREVKQRADTAQKDGGFKWMSGIEGVV